MVVVQKSPKIYAHGLLDREEVLQKARKYGFFRRMQDVIRSLPAVVLLWPMMLFTAMIIVINSPGASPIFGQPPVRLVTGRSSPTGTTCALRNG